MTTLSETLTLGLVLVLLFGSICLYLYTRVQQTEQKLNLVESILLDLKMTSEIKNYPELAAPSGGGAGSSAATAGEAVVHESNVVEAATGLSENLAPMAENISVDMGSGSPAVVASTAAPVEEASSGAPSTMNYTEMTLSELKAIAKQRGIVGGGGMRRAQLIEALNTSDRSSVAEEKPFLESA